MNYNKYIKYKSKYLKLKKQLGGECDPVPEQDYKDPVYHSNLLNLLPEYRITINGRCYDVRDLHDWVIKRKQPLDPLKNKVSDKDITRINDAFNNIPLTLEQIQEIINKIYDNRFDYINASLQIRSNKNITLAAVTKMD